MTRLREEVLVRDGGGQTLDVWAGGVSAADLEAIKGISMVFKEREKGHYHVQVDPRYDKQAVVDLVEQTLWMIVRGQIPEATTDSFFELPVAARPPEPEAPASSYLSQKPPRIPLLCRWGLWHRWGKWSESGIAGHYHFDVDLGKYIASDVCVQARQCRRCGLVRVRVVR